MVLRLALISSASTDPPKFLNSSWSVSMDLVFDLTSLASMDSPKFGNSSISQSKDTWSALMRFLFFIAVVGRLFLTLYFRNSGSIMLN